MNEPSYPGLYLVRGIRYTASRNGIVSVNDLCEVRRVRFRREDSLAVYFLGRSQPFALELFDADFRPLRVAFDGERCS